MWALILHLAPLPPTHHCLASTPSALPSPEGILAFILQAVQETGQTGTGQEEEAGPPQEVMGPGEPAPCSWLPLATPEPPRPLGWVQAGHPGLMQLLQIHPSKGHEPHTDTPPPQSEDLLLHGPDWRVL